jgi:hypothetical protein
MAPEERTRYLEQRQEAKAHEDKKLAHLQKGMRSYKSASGQKMAKGGRGRGRGRGKK